MKVDFAKFAQSLPYASELYGIYQPLLGWRSQLQKETLRVGLVRTNRDHLKARLAQFDANYVVHERPTSSGRVSFDIGRGRPKSQVPTALQGSGTIIGRTVLERVVAAGVDDPIAWMKATSTAAIDETLAQCKHEIEAAFKAAITQAPNEDPSVVLKGILDRESQMAGVLASLSATGKTQQVMSYFNPAHDLSLDPRDTPVLAPTGLYDLMHAVLSPIGIVHLYRQYFFEFDTFLGPPVQHLWLSDGGTVELVETSTRKKLVERYSESTLQTTETIERSTVSEDELSDAVRSENQSNTKVGISVSSDTRYDLGVIRGAVNPQASLDLEQTSKQAREQIHRALRQQTDKISSEIRKSFKSTFKTVTETTDTQSRRYSIQNTSGKLMNYELRRKMRQVGVQVQDFGVQLCWQAYVDDPGAELGLAHLVHIATPEDLLATPTPEGPVMPEPVLRAEPVSIPLKWRSGDVNRSGFIPMHPPLQLTPPKQDYLFDRAEVRISAGPPWRLRAFPSIHSEEETRFEGHTVPTKADAQLIDAGNGQTERSVRSLILGLQADPPIQDDSEYDWTVQLTVFYRPSQKLILDTQAAYTKKLDDYKLEQARLMEEALFKAARDRVNEAASISPRPVEDLREEERIVIYRNLIRTLLKTAGVNNDDPKLRHVFAELVQSMFDVDRMLYFVAPEWWKPRENRFEHESPQQLGLSAEQSTSFAARYGVSWGGIEDRPDNYYITKDSAAAKLGSSLGWMLQLDGDNLRNAFLNAPWVKAVVPIRPGREWEALRWLESSYIEGSDGLGAAYKTSDASEKPKMLARLQANVWDDAFRSNRYAQMTSAEEITVGDAIRYLILCLQAVHAKGQTPVTDPQNPANSYLPTDEVFEHGFDPLLGGFRAQGHGDFRVFDQWVEVLPTDQIVPVEVEYDPKTGMQV